jgi:ribosomal protein S18 acetylase RimI-like enzyme
VRQAIATPSARAELRGWPLDESIGHLVMVDVSMVPTPEQVDGWLAAAYTASDPVLAVRTGALYPGAAAVFAERGFDVIDRLVLLERALLHQQPTRRDRRARTAGLRRARRRDLRTMAAIDQSAFPAGWRNDVTSLDAITDATPSSRIRLARLDRSATGTVGFAITGKAGTTGYLQRIAVRPDARRLGIGRQLVDDAVDWLMRRGASRVLVNTGDDNRSALQMYEQASFERLDDELVVLEHRRAS